MAVPANRVPVRIARGTYANLLAGLASLADGEICYAKDEDALYVKEGGSLVAAGALAAASISDLGDVDTTGATTGKGLVFDGTNWTDQTILSSLSADTAPTLGGNLTVGTHKIVSASNNNINIAPNGNGVVKIEGNGTGGAGRIALTDETASNYVTLKGPAAAAAANYVLTLPTTDGNAGEALTSNGTGILSWVEYIPLATLKTEVAASTDFADFQARIAAL